MDLDEKSLKSWRKSLGKLYNHELSDDEIREAAFNLVGYMKLLIKMDQKLKREKAEKALDLPTDSRHQSTQKGTKWKT